LAIFGHEGLDKLILNDYVVHASPSTWYRGSMF
jgi:hypothetical protein